MEYSPDDLELTPLQSLVLWLLVVLSLCCTAGLMAGILYAGFERTWPDLITALVPWFR